MKWLSLSRARYTFPNFPLPRGCPISKSSIVSCRSLTEEEEKSFSLEVRWRERGTPNARLPFPLSSRSAPFLFSRAQPGCLVSSSQSHEPTLHTHSLLFTSSPTHFPSFSRYNAKGTHVVGTLGSVWPSAAAEKKKKKKELSTFSSVSSPIPDEWYQGFFLNPLSLVLVLLPLTRGLSIVGLHHSL